MSSEGPLSRKFNLESKTSHKQKLPNYLNPLKILLYSEETSTFNRDTGFQLN